MRALEVPIEVTCIGSRAAELAHAVTRAWAWCADDDPPEAQARLTVMLDDGTLIASHGRDSDLVGTDLGLVMDNLSPVITRLVVAARAGELTMFHACALADPATGHTAVLFGPSGTGKTTLARTLGTAFSYLTDETAAVDGDGLLVPYPKPLSVLTRPGDPLKDQLSPGDLGLRPIGPGPHRLAALVQLHRDPEHRGAATLEVLPTIDALPELVEQTSFTRLMERPLHQLADIAASVGGVRRATYAESADLLPIVTALVAGGA